MGFLFSCLQGVVIVLAINYVLNLFGIEPI